MRAVEAMATVEEDGQLRLDQPLPAGGPERVRVFLLFPEDNDIEEKVWLAAGVSNDAFDFLNDPAEDVYSPSDGKPFEYEV
jgi:hypothetical protein